MCILNIHNNINEILGIIEIKRWKKIHKTCKIQQTDLHKPVIVLLAIYFYCKNGVLGDADS